MGLGLVLDKARSKRTRRTIDKVEEDGESRQKGDSAVHNRNENDEKVPQQLALQIMLCQIEYMYTWGAGGSKDVCSPNKMHYGGNTTCLELRSK